MHHDINTRRQQAHSQKTFGKILQAITALETERGHCTCQDNWDFEIRERLFQEKTSLNHRIRAVRHDDWGFLGQKSLHCRENQLSVRISHFEATFCEEGPDMHLRIREPKKFQISFDFTVEIRNRPSVLRVRLLDRAACG